MGAIMIGAWLSLPVTGIVVALAVGYGLTTALIAWLTFRSPLSARIQQFSGIVAPYFNALALLFALLTGFLAGDVMERHGRAVRAVQTEGSALADLDALTRAATSDGASIRAALHNYLESVLDDEWPQMANEEPSAKTEAALAALLRIVADPQIATAAGPVVHSAFVTLALRATAARSDRLALSSQQSDDLRWLTVLLLCLITQIGIGMVHLERPRAHIAAVSLFSLAAVVALGLIAMQESPFDGAIRVSSAPLQRALNAVAR
jgi:hypothetical protein